MYYLAGLGIAVVTYLLVGSIGLIVLVGLVLGGLLHTSERLRQVERKLGLNQAQAWKPGDDEYGDAERKRIAEMLGKPRK